MMKLLSYDQIRDKVAKFLDESRFEHSLNVENEAVKLGNIYGVDILKCRVAAITHDFAKNFTDEELLKKAVEFGLTVDEVQSRFPQLLHGPVGAELCKSELGIDDEDILNAVYYHTTGRKAMSMLEKIIYLSDMIGADRDFPGIESIRDYAPLDINKALLLSCNTAIVYIIKRNYLIHPLTIELRNSIL